MKLLIKRGVLADIGTLDEGRLYLATDTYDLYVGTSAGNKLVGDSSLATDYLKIDASNDPITGTLTLQNSADAQELIVKGKSGQTANLQEYQNSSATVLASVSGTGVITAPNFISSVATGTQPIAVTSTTVNTNLNSDLLDGQHGAYYAPASGINGSFTTVDLKTITVVNGVITAIV